jgi:2-keto-4-pentenoate hydratase/2-oxohepta-3-ene-1,7-dioic acid hydratase in catechol pathway
MNTIICQGEQLTPSKIICVGRNYLDHIKELSNEIPSNMVLFSKPNSAICEDLTAVRGEQLHFEAELCFLYRAGSFFAAALGLDLTRRQLQSELKKKGLPWERCKAFDGSALFSNFVPVGPSFHKLSLELRINSRIVQTGSVSQMIYKPDQILAEIQTFMTLLDGDIVMTGTPAGVGLIYEGDQFEGRIFDGPRALVGKKWSAV